MPRLRPEDSEVLEDIKGDVYNTIFELLEDAFSSEITGRAATAAEKAVEKIIRPELEAD